MDKTLINDIYLTLVNGYCDGCSINPVAERAVHLLSNIVHKYNEENYAVHVNYLINVINDSNQQLKQSINIDKKRKRKLLHNNTQLNKKMRIK